MPLAGGQSRALSPNLSFSNNYTIESKRNKNKSPIDSEHDSYESLPNLAGLPGEKRDHSVQHNLEGSGSKLRMYIKDMPDFVIDSPDVKISGQKTKQIY